MIHEKQNPVGVDAVVQDIQNHLYRELPVLWNIDPEAYNCYGRAYRKKEGFGYVPVFYAGGREYGPLVVNDKVAVTSFFGGPANARIKGNRSTAFIHLVFMLNLAKIQPARYQGLNHRTDEEIHCDVLDVLRSQYRGKVVHLITGVDESLRDYPGTRTNDQAKRDLQPFHIFRLEIEVAYINENC